MKSVKRLTRHLLAGLIVVLLGVAPGARAAEPADEPAGARQAVEALVAALNAGDWQTLGSLFTEHGDVVDHQGHLASVRDRITVLTSALESDEGAAAGAEATNSAAPAQPRRMVELDQARLVTDDVALVDGWGHTAAVGGVAEPLRRFSVVLVRRENRWLIDAVREGPSSTVVRPADIHELDWLLGTWEGQTEQAQYRFTARLSDDGRFVLRDFSVAIEGKLVFQGQQRIGWDPRGRSFKSWNFDADGGIGEGTWSKTGDSWLVEATSVAPDGSESTAVNTYTPLAKDRVVLQSIGARSGGIEIPDVLVELVRKGDTP